MTATVTPRPVRAGSRTRITVLLAAAVAVVALELVLGIATGAAESLVLFVTLLLAHIALVAAGAVLIRDERHLGLGTLLLGTATAGAVWNLSTLDPAFGPSYFLSAFLYWIYAAMIVHLVLRWPDRRLEGRLPRVLVVCAYALMPLLTALWELTWRVRWFGGAAARYWWPTLVPARDFSASTWQVQQLLFIALVAAALVVVIVRTLGAHGPRRLVLAPVAVAAVLLAATVVLQIVQGLGADVPVDGDVVQNLALLAVPVAVLVAALRRPAAVDRDVMPGRRLADEDAGTRYLFGVAAVTAGVIVVAAVAIAIASAGPAPVPTPQPGPAVPVAATP